MYEKVSKDEDEYMCGFNTQYTHGGACFKCKLLYMFCGDCINLNPGADFDEYNGPLVMCKFLGSDYNCPRFCDDGPRILRPNIPIKKYLQLTDEHDQWFDTFEIIDKLDIKAGNEYFGFRIANDYGAYVVPEDEQNENIGYYLGDKDMWYVDFDKYYYTGGDGGYDMYFKCPECNGIFGESDK